MSRKSSLVRLAYIVVPVVALSSCSSGGPETLKIISAADARAGAAAGAPTQDEMYRTWNVEYKIVGSLPDLGDDAVSWSMRKLSKTDVLETFQDVATELNVEGAVTNVEGETSSWVVGSDERTGRRMWLWWGEREAWWNFIAEDNAADVVRSCTTTPDGGEDCVETKPVMSQPANLPSRTAAESRVRQVIAAAGEDPTDFELRTTIDTWGVYVQASRMFDGVPSAFTWWFSLGENGEILYASGQIVDPERGETYPLIEPGRALKRLATPMYAMERGDAVPMAAEDAATGGSDTSTGETVPSIDTSTTLVVTTSSTPPPTVPSTPPIVISTSTSMSPTSTSTLPSSTTASPTTTVPPTETTVIVVTGVRLSLMPAYLVDGGLVALPAYTFSNDDGEVGTVYAIDGKYLQYPDPAVTDVKGGSEPSGGSGSSESSPATRRSPYR